MSLLVYNASAHSYVLLYYVFQSFNHISINHTDLLKLHQHIFKMSLQVFYYLFGPQSFILVVLHEKLHVGKNYVLI
jgi:hypothetical protein